jgi:hypothetical protein
MEKNTVTIEIIKKDNSSIKTIENESVGIFLGNFYDTYGTIKTWELTIKTNDNKTVKITINKDPITLESTINCINI